MQTCGGLVREGVPHTPFEMVFFMMNMKKRRKNKIPDDDDDDDDPAWKRHLFRGLGFSDKGTNASLLWKPPLGSLKARADCRVCKNCQDHGPTCLL